MAQVVDPRASVLGGESNWKSCLVLLTTADRFSRI